jgi:hypothetical protein
MRGEQDGQQACRSTSLVARTRPARKPKYDKIVITVWFRRLRGTTQPLSVSADTPRMPKRLTKITITLSHADLVLWHSLARKLGVTFEQLAKESVELAYARGSTR